MNGTDRENCVSELIGAFRFLSFAPNADDEFMRIDEALKQVDAMSALAQRATTYRGLRSTTIAATGVLGIAAALAQPFFIGSMRGAEQMVVELWVAVAIGSLAVIVGDMIVRYYEDPTARARRLTLSVLSRLSPSIIVGGGLTFVFAEKTPESIWMLPGLWAILLGLGVYSASVCLPRELHVVGLWYIACGFVALIVLPHLATFPPAAMAIPFGGGQLLTAWLIYQHQERPTANSDQGISE